MKRARSSHPHPRILAQLVLGLLFHVAAWVVSGPPWLYLVLAGTGWLVLLRQMWVTVYWFRRRDLVRAHGRMLKAVHMLPAGVHCHTQDGACFRRFDSRPWHFLVVFPAEDNRIRRDQTWPCDGVVSVYALRHGGVPIVTHHHMPVRFWPDGSAEGFNADDLPALTDRGQPDMHPGLLEMSETEIDDLLRHLGTAAIIITRWPPHPKGQ